MMTTAILRVQKRKGERATRPAEFTLVSLARTVTYAPFSGQATLGNCRPGFSQLAKTDPSLESEHILSQNKIRVSAMREKRMSISLSYHLFTFIPGHEMEDDATSMYLINVWSVAQLTPIIDKSMGTECSLV